MRIKQLSFKEHDTGWELEPTEFFPGVTLLVGASGVGKTRILRAIHSLQYIAQSQLPPGSFVSGIEWDLFYSGRNGSEYHWTGRYSGVKDNMTLPANEETGTSGDLATPPRVVEERLLVDDTPLIERDAQTIRFVGNPTPKLSPHASCLSLLSHEDKIAPAHRAWANLLRPADDPENNQEGFVLDFSANYDRYPTFEMIRDSSLRTQHKLALAHRNAPEMFQRLLDQFREIFPMVEELAIRMQSVTERVRNPLSSDRRIVTRERPAIVLKEVGNSSWVPQERISSGMWRTLMHLARMALWPDGTVVLIDEFENSLGVNCLDAVTEAVNDNCRRLQFIMTSHHPYVINNIPPNQWKIVTRKGSVVTARNAADVGIGKSRHEAFIQLINNSAYRQGIIAL